MTYTINPNAKNVWIRDNEDTMDLSPITDASSVYLENGRTLEQELGEGSMVSNVATVDNSMTKVIDGTLDGAYESGVMYGRSLVNCVEQSMFNPKYMSRVETEGGFVYTQTEYQVATRLQFDYTQHPLLNNNTYYLISFELKVNKARTLNITTDGTGYEGYGLQIEENTHTLIRQKIKFSPNGTVLRIYVRCKGGIDYTNDTFTLKNLMLIPYQEGMENWDIPYFEGICDVKMPILRNVGKNLFDSSQIIQNKAIAWASGKIITLTNGSQTHENFIPINYKSTYSVSGCNYIAICFYDANKQPVGFLKESSKNEISQIGVAGTTHVTDFNVSNYPNVRYMRITIRPNNGGLRDISTLQIEESPSSTTYEDYKTNILHTPETVTLRSLPNGVRDELNLKTGEYIKRIGEVVLDGSEGWSLDVEASSSENTAIFYTGKNFNGFKQLPNYADRETGILCDKFPIIPSAWYEDCECMMVNQDARIYIRISRQKLSSVDIQGLKSWLATNPTKVCCELATSIIKKVNLTQSEPIVKIGTELPNGVCDTYNLLTGEHIQRVGKVVLDGSEVWTKVAFPSTNTTHCYSSLKIENLKMPNVNEKNIVSDRFQTVAQESYNYSNEEMYTWRTGELLYVNILRSRLSTSDVQGLKAWFKENPTTVWYELKNPIVTKKNGLPNTHGVTLPNGVRDKYNESTGVYTQNIGRTTFDGGEDWRQNQEGSYGFYCYHNESKDSSSFNCKELDAITGWNDYTQKGIFRGSVAWGVVVKSTDLTSCTVEAFKAWLKQNPITVEYEMVTPKTVDITPINVGQVLPNGVCDTYNPITKQYTKRVGFIALNGSEDWVKHTGDSNQCTYKTTNVLSGYKITSSYCDTMKTEVIDSGISSVYGYSFIRVGEVDASDGGDFGVFLHLEGGDIIQDVASLKTKLKLNPLNLWYELQTPEVTTVDLDLSTLYSANPIAYKDGHVILESGHDGQSLLPTLEYSTVTNRVKQIESIGEQVLRQEKQLSMLEQMLIKNIVEMDYNNTLLTLNLEIDEVM